MHILFASSEAAPFAKTGGLGDVGGALPRALAELGCETTLILPLYKTVRQGGFDIRPLDIEFEITIGDKTVKASLEETILPDSSVRVVLVRQDDYFDRDGLYAEGTEDYPDNSERFIFFCRAVIEAAQTLGRPVDVLHANDWQTGLLPALLQVKGRKYPVFENAVSVMTIHNLAFQGIYWHFDMKLTGLDWEYFNYHQMEYYGRLNLLKTGVSFCDALTTVSPQYSNEIQTEHFGHGLDSLMRHRSEHLSGILNGIDVDVWDPETDPELVANYNVETALEGKSACKADLQRMLGLKEDPDALLIGAVGRLTHQKGTDWLADLIPAWCQGSNVQWVVLGTGDPQIERLLHEASTTHPDRVAVRLEFSESLAHKIYAGSDLFCMPSRFEPCGLSQLNSLRYGTAPIVRCVGGLADTVVDTNEETLASGTANGFCFSEETYEACDATVRRAVETFQDPELRRQLISNGMHLDYSWSKSAQQYVALYQEVIQSRKSGE
jgi:starch synthase